MGSFRDRMKVPNMHNWSSSILNDLENDSDRELKSIIERMLTSKYGEKQYNQIKNESEKQYFTYKKIGLGLYKNCIEHNSIEPKIKEMFQTEDSLEKLIGRFASKCSKLTEFPNTSEVKVLPSITKVIKQLLIEDCVIKNIDFLIQNNKNKNLSYDDMFVLQQQAFENLKTAVIEGEIPWRILVHFQSPSKIKKAIDRNINEWKEKENTTGEIIYSEEISITMQKMIDEQNQEKEIIDI